MSLGQTAPAAVWFPAGRIVPAAPQHHAECLIRMTDTERFPMASLLLRHSLSPHYPGQCVKGTPLLQDWDNEIRMYGSTRPRLSKLTIWNSVMLAFLLFTFSFTSLWHSNARQRDWRGSSVTLSGLRGWSGLRERTCSVKPLAGCWQLCSVLRGPKTEGLKFGL